VQFRVFSAEQAANLPALTTELQVLLQRDDPAGLERSAKRLSAKRKTERHQQAVKVLSEGSTELLAAIERRYDWNDAAQG